MYLSTILFFCLSCLRVEGRVSNGIPFIPVHRYKFTEFTGIPKYKVSLSMGLSAK